jgi:hypothetical protein
MAFNTLLSTSLTPTLTWAAITGATNYRIAIANDQSFAIGVVLIDDATLVAATYTVGGGVLVTGQKYYWRFMAKVGGVWGTWRPLRSFFVNTAAAASYTPTATGWAFIDPDTSTDFYKFAVAPNYEIDHVHQRRGSAKNIQGDALTEFVSTRDSIVLTFGPSGKNAGGSAYVFYDQLAEMIRFFHMRKSILLVGVTSYVADNHERIWKVDFSQQPQITPIAPGREDYFEVVFPLEESALQ